MWRREMDQRDVAKDGPSAEGGENVLRLENKKRSFNRSKWQLWKVVEEAQPGAKTHPVWNLQ